MRSGKANKRSPGQMPCSQMPFTLQGEISPRRGTQSLSARRDPSHPWNVFTVLQARFTPSWNAFTVLPVRFTRSRIAFTVLRVRFIPSMNRIRCPPEETHLIHGWHSRFPDEIHPIADRMNLLGRRADLRARPTPPSRDRRKLSKHHIHALAESIDAVRHRMEAVAARDVPCRQWIVAFPAQPCPADARIHSPMQRRFHPAAQPGVSAERISAVALLRRILPRPRSSTR
jgi:hypothetical protein